MGATEDGGMSMSTRCVLASLALLVSWSVSSEAHDIYTGLTDRNGASCCNHLDCRPARYRMTPAGVEMYVNGKWIAVPDDTIQYRMLPGDTGETAGGHWCGYDFGQRIRTLCTILPPNSAGLSVRGRP
jgi:hypothetical protein